MVSNFAFLSNLLLASVALAVSSSSQVRAPLARSREARQSSASNTRYSNAHAGAVWVQGDGTFTSVSAAIDVPTLTGDDGIVMAWVGIDTDGTKTCKSGAFFRAGIESTISGGKVSYSAWFQWHPEYEYVFPEITVNANDTITVYLTTDSTTTGEVYMQNQNSGEYAWHDFTASESHALCGASASWMASSDSINTTNNPLADFDLMIFSSASASDPNGILFTPDGATTNLNIQQNNVNRTSLFAMGTTILVMHLQA